MNLVAKAVSPVLCHVAFIIAAGLPLSASAASFVHNGSLEDVNASFVNVVGNYMPLSAGSTAIGSWLVSPTTINEIVWASTPTSDGHGAADGTFFADLSGFGTTSPNGAIQQTLHNLIIGQVYSFSMETFVNGVQPIVTVGATTLTLAAGSSHTVGATTWTSHTASFTAGAVNPLLSVASPSAGQSIIFIDNISVTGPVAAIPEPETYAMLIAGLGLLGFMARRKNR